MKVRYENEVFEGTPSEIVEQMAKNSRMGSEKPMHYKQGVHLRAVIYSGARVRIDSDLEFIEDLINLGILRQEV